MSEHLSQYSRRIVNAFGAIGYSLLLSVCVVMTGTALLWMTSGGYLQLIGVPPESLESTRQATDDGSPTSSIVLIIAYFFTALMALASIFIAISLPFWLGKIGSKLLKRAIRLCQVSVTPVSLVVGKMIACGTVAVPFMIFIIIDVGNFTLVIAGLAAVGLSLMTFVLQHALARVSRLEAKEIW